MNIENLQQPDTRSEQSKIEKVDNLNDLLRKKHYDPIKLKQSIKDAVTAHGAYNVAEQIVEVKRDNPLFRKTCLQAAVFLIPYTSMQAWGKTFFSHDGVLTRLDDVPQIMKSYLITESKKRGVTSFSNIPYPSALRRGITMTLENGTWEDFEKYNTFQKGFKLVDAVKYCHPNPKKCNSTTRIPLVDYVSHMEALSDENKSNKLRYDKLIKAAKKRVAKDGTIKIDAFHGLIYGFIKFNKELNEEEKLEDQLIDAEEAIREELENSQQ